MNPTDPKVAHALAAKLAAKKKAQRENRPLAQKIDDKGQVTIWHLGRKAYIKVWPVDAMDMIGRGHAALCDPDNNVAETLNEPEPEPDDEPNTDSLDGMTVTELRAVAGANGIDLGALTKKADIISAIRTALVSGGQ